MSEQYVMYISSDKNNGYPCHPNLPEPEKFKFDEPYPEKMFRISPTENNGYPCHPNLPEHEKFKFDEPYPKKMFRMSADINNGYPHLPFLQPKPNLYIQPSKPLIHVYGNRQQSFDKNTNDFDGNGYAVIEPVTCEVRQEENGVYSLSLETYCDEYGKYKYLKKQSLIKVPVKYHGLLKWQIFRIVIATRYINENGLGMVKVEATHLFYDNNRYLIKDSRPTQTDGKGALNWLIKDRGQWYGNERASYPFAYSSDIPSVRTAYFENVNITAALLGVDQCFINRWGGRLYRDNYYFSINREMEGSKDIGIIQYGFNMTEIELTEDDTDLLTDLIAKDNFGNITHISNPDIPNELIPHRIYKYVTFSYEENDKAAFLADVQAYYNEYKQSSVNIKVRFVNLTDIALYKDFLMLDNFEVGDKVTVYHKDMDIYYSNLEIISKTYDVVAQQTTEMEIGNFKNAISRRPFMSETAGGGNSASDKQNAAVQAEIKDNKLKMLSTWRGARAFTWREISKFTWREVSKNGRENNES